MLAGHSPGDHTPAKIIGGSGLNALKGPFAPLVSGSSAPHGSADERLLGDPPAHRAGSVWEQRVPGPQLPGVVSGVTLLSGIWLVLAPFVWSYGDTGGGFDARWNNLLVGLAVAVVGYIRLTRPVRLITVSAPAIVLGVWLTIAPFALAYGLGTDSTRPTLNDITVGTLLIAITLIGHLTARDDDQQGFRPAPG